MVLAKFKVKRKFKEDIEPEEILADSKRLKESEDSEREKLEKPIKQKVLKIFFAFIIIILVALFLKTFQMQIINGDYWREVADENRIRSYPVKALRGIIYDRNMIPLAINVPKLDLVVVPADLARLEGFEDIKERVKDSIHLSYPVVIEEDIELERALLLETQYADVPAINIRQDSRREYENGPYFAHVLGYLSKVNEQEVNQGYFLDDYIGRTGLENYYEDLLRGVDGEQLVEVDNLGKTQKVLARKESKPGSDLVLSIDAELQKKLYQSLKGKLSTLATSRAAAIALDPSNGKILALVSFPSFDNNDFAEALSLPNQPFFNRAISGMYPPGSTIKPLIAAGALKEGIVSVNKQIYCPGYLSIADKYNPDVFWTFNDWKEHGIVNIVKAIAESCNVFFFTVGGGHDDIEGLGINRIAKYLKLFGWGQKLGIDLPGESSGFIPSAVWKEQTKNERWYVGDTYNVSIGQGDIMATPLQVAISTAAIANGGKIFQPQMIENKRTKILNQNFIDKDYLEVVRRGMREAVIYGSAQMLYELPIKVAGKTGTAQVGGGKASHGWFTSFAPYDNPEIVLTVLVENGGGGTIAAAPVVKDVLNWYFNR